MSFNRQQKSPNPVAVLPQKHPGAEWLDTHRGQLKNKQWVAASNQGIKAEAPTIGELMSKIQSLDIPVEDLAIAFITDDFIA